MTQPSLFIREQLNHPGEHRFFLSGAIGKLEVALLVPEEVNKNYIALLGHPHSLQGGTMNNKVVTTLARTFKELHIASLRFNFRGVGESDGQYDAGKGESEDMLMIAHYLQQIPGMHLLFAGFSFGSYVAYRAAAQCKHDLLITIAPSVQHYDYKEFSPNPKPWIVVHGDNDEVVPFQAVLDFVENTTSPLSFLRFSETGHFFHGKLLDLKTRLTDLLCQQIRYP